MSSPVIPTYTVVGDVLRQSVTVERASKWPAHRYTAPIEQYRFDQATGACLVAMLIRAVEGVERITNATDFEEMKSVAVQLLKEHWITSDSVRGPDPRITTRSEYLTMRLTSPVAEDTYTAGADRIRISEQSGPIQEAAGAAPTVQPIEGSHLVLSLDLPGIVGETSSGDGLGVEKLLKEMPKQKFHGCTMRINVPRRTRKASHAQIQNASDRVAAFLEHHVEGLKVGVIASESLRTIGLDISYRVAWGRTIAETLVRMRNLKGCCLSFLKNLDYIVVSFYNDGALIIPLKALDGKAPWDPGSEVLQSAPEEDGDGSSNPGEEMTDEEGSARCRARYFGEKPHANFQDEARACWGRCVFVSAPFAVEGDLSTSFNGITKGTETMLTASLARAVSRLMTEFDDSRGWSWPEKVMRELQKATVHGIKASRYLQVHGLVSIHRTAAELMQHFKEKGSPWSEKFKPADKSDKSNAIENVFNTVAAGSKDCLHYIWNRLQSAYFFHAQNDVTAWESFLKSETGNDGFVTWPIGDVAEILHGGYPSYGSFPPIALKLEGGREANREETDLVYNSWQQAGWVGIARFQQEEIHSNSSRFMERVFRDASSQTDHDKRWWTFRDILIKQMAAKLVFNGSGSGKQTAESSRKEESEKRALVRGLFCETVIRYGTKQLNRTSASFENAFDIRLLERLVAWHSYITQSTPEVRPAWVTSLFGSLQNLDLAKSLANILGLDFEKPDLVSDIQSLAEPIEIEKLVRSHSWRKEPTGGSLLGFLPEFRMGKLYSFDRRDTQSYRDLSQRISNYVESGAEVPLNVGVFGAPGSGKSFAVKEILRHVLMGKADPEFLAFNLASFSANGEALTEALLEIQNVGLKGKIPVVFWDEFDTSVGDDKLAWLSRFLGPMQDGEFFVGQRVRKLPRCVFVFAGSMFTSFGEISVLDRVSRGEKIVLERLFRVREQSPPLYVTSQADVEKWDGVKVSAEEWRKAKGRDFISRLTAILDINGVDRDLGVLVPCHFEPDLSKQDESGKAEKVLGEISETEISPHHPDLGGDPNQSKLIGDWQTSSMQASWNYARFLTPEHDGDLKDDDKTQVSQYLEEKARDASSAGGITVKLSLTDSDFSYFYRRAVAIRSGFEREAGHLIQKSGELLISDEVLFSMLLAPDGYKHGQRSLESLIRMSNLSGRSIADASVTPTGSQARIHASSSIFTLPSDAKFPANRPVEDVEGGSA